MPALLCRECGSSLLQMGSSGRCEEPCGAERTRTDPTCRGPGWFQSHERLLVNHWSDSQGGGRPRRRGLRSTRRLPVCWRDRLKYVVLASQTRSANLRRSEDGGYKLIRDDDLVGGHGDRAQHYAI